MAEVAPGQITAAEAAAMARMIAPELKRYASRYDVEKYSPDVLRELREVFSRPATVGKREIERALRWKFGHGDKLHIPQAHTRLIADLTELWPRFAPLAGSDSDAMCRFLLEQLNRPHAFVSVAFLTHLVGGGKVPIVDQHNLRAVNHLLREVRPAWRMKRKPTGIEDLHLVGEFMDRVTAAWPKGGVARPTKEVLDRYLTMYGKAIKSGTAAANKLSGAAFPSARSHPGDPAGGRQLPSTG